MDNRIFRKGALERLSSPDQLDQLMPVTSARGWIALCGVGLLLAAGIAWGFLGRIETNVEASGALVRSGGVVHVKAPAAGRVRKVLVSIGQNVEQGQPLIRFEAEGSGAGNSGTDSVGETSSAEGPAEKASSAEDPSAESGSGDVKSPLRGRVLDIAVDGGADVGGAGTATGDNVAAGDQVAADDILIIVERPDLPLRAVVYVPTAEGYTLKPGMEARIRLASSYENDAETLTGKVRSASRFPVSRSSMMRSLQNEQWVDELLRTGPLLEVSLDLASTSPPEDLYSGTPCRAVITVDQKRPIALVVPIFEPVKDSAQ